MWCVFIARCRTQASLVSVRRVAIKAIPDGITSVTASDAALHVIKTDDGCRIETATPQQVMVFDVNGKTIWTGSTPSNIELKHGVYIVRSASGEVVKLVK